MVTIYPIYPDFAAEIGDVDLSRPMSPDILEAIEQAFWKWAVLIFPGQTLTIDQHIAFTANFGPIEKSLHVYRSDIKLRLDPQVADVSNLQPDETLWEKNSRMRMFQLGNRMWHTDSSFMHVPALASALYSRSIAPIGGHTQLCDERAAYDALPEEMKCRIDGLVVEHSIFNSRAKLGFSEFSDEERQAMPPVKQALVRTLPQSGRKALYLASHTGRIDGMSAEESRILLDQLTAHATDRRFVYTHRWRVDDLLMWDNRCTMHRGTDFDDLRWKRDMQRATVSDTANSCDIAATQVNRQPASSA
jgi:alpha-ketoglutarate-dependent 2,4-dichlorophenoxyacetate dioxygenase